MIKGRGMILSGLLEEAFECVCTGGLDVHVDARQFVAFEGLLGCYVGYAE